MNWLDKRLGGDFIKLGLTISLLALILFSCEEPNGLGEDFISEWDTVGVYSVELPVKTAIYQRDSVILQDVFVGKYDDPKFGTIEAEGYSSLIPVSYAHPKDIRGSEYDSITITLKIANLYGPDVEGAQDLRIYQLEDTISNIKIVGQDTLRDNFIFNKKSYNRFLGETTIRIRETQPSPASINYDSIYVSFRLNDELGQEIFDKANSLDPTDSITFTSRRLMRNFLKGIAYVPGDNSSAVFLYNIWDAKALITMHYHTDTDTLRYNIRLVEQSLFGYAHTHLQVDRSGTELQALPSNELYTLPENKVFVQSGTHISTVLDFSSMIDLFNSIDRPMVINAAVLYLDVEPHLDYLKPLDNLSLICVDSVGQPIFVWNEQYKFYPYYSISSGSPTLVSTDSQPYSTKYIKSRGGYMIDVTLFMQEMAHPNRRFTKIALFPHAYFNSNKRFTALSSLNQFIVDPNKIKLKVYYTTL